MILVIGSDEEAHARFMFEKLKRLNKDIEYFDSRLYPYNILINYTSDLSSGFLKINDKKIHLKDIQGVYWRWFYGINYEKTEDEYASDMIYRERESALNSLFLSLKCNWLNSYEAIKLHKTKIYQLNILQKNGIRVPKTLITNDEDELIDFYKKNNKSVIYKPVLGGALTQKLTDDDLTKEKLSELKQSPIQLQEYIKGIDIRTFAFKNKNVYSAEIYAKTLDFRGDDNHEIINTTLPDSVNNDCLKVLNLLKLTYSGIDIRKTPEGEYVFIEANPAPMFIHVENVTKYPISDNIIELLCQ